VTIKKADRVVLPFNFACGYCFNCRQGNTHAGLTMNPEGASAAYGYAGMGPYAGGQAEFVLVPHADFHCLSFRVHHWTNGNMTSCCWLMVFLPRSTPPISPHFSNPPPTVYRFPPSKKRFSFDI
jgi:D-arabinose 1-dehydrogenase-like Zn-dependent alcohol dehydrogenase